MRVLRRRTGLSQQELAYLIGHTKGHLSHIEDGSRIPHFSEGLMIELIFGLAVGSIFIQLRETADRTIERRVRVLKTNLEHSESTHSRVAYKTAQLERILASTRSRDEFNQCGPQG